VAAAEDGALGAAAAAHVAGARQAICAEEIILSISISISCSLHCRRRLCAPPASSHEALPLLAALGGEETPEFGR
jgi:sulfopyruvate decarboxylase TPP-binding subunit